MQNNMCSMIHLYFKLHEQKHSGRLPLGMGSREETHRRKLHQAKQKVLVVALFDFTVKHTHTSSQAPSYRSALTPPSGEHCLSPSPTAPCMPLHHRTSHTIAALLAGFPRWWSIALKTVRLLRPSQHLGGVPDTQ